MAKLFTRTIRVSNNISEKGLKWLLDLEAQNELQRGKVSIAELRGEIVGAKIKSVDKIEWHAMGNPDGLGDLLELGQFAIIYMLSVEIVDKPKFNELSSIFDEKLERFNHKNLNNLRRKKSNENSSFRQKHSTNQN